MVNNVQVAATRSRRTAAGIYDATEGPHRLAFELVEGAAAGFPPEPGRNGCEEGSTNIKTAGEVALKINGLTKRREEGPGGQRIGVYADIENAGTRWNKCYKAVGVRVPTSLDAAIGTKCRADMNARR